jgi:hypothetical protein
MIRNLIGMIHVPKVGMGTRLRALLLLFAVAVAVSAAPRVRLGGVSVSGGYSHGWGPGYWGPGYWGPYWRSPLLWSYYDPFWYGSWMYPGYYTGYAQGPGMGEVKLAASDKDAVVLIDGAYAGEARKLKSMWLEPGVYNLEVRHGDTSFERRIYVLSGKTLELRAELKPRKEAAK